MTTQWPLLAILAGYVLLTALYGWATPPFEGPDESEHYAYVERLAAGKGLPPQGEAAWETGIAQEAGQPPFYYWVASLLARLAGVDAPPATFRPNPYFTGPFPRTTVDNDNQAIHLAGDARPLRGGWLAFYLSRAVTTCFGALLIVAVYALGRQIAPNEHSLATYAALLTAVTPQVLHISTVVSNDIPAAALGAVALWLLALMVRGRRWAWLAAAVGSAIGLAGLTKVSALSLAVPSAALLVWLWCSQRMGRRGVLTLGVAMALGSLGVAGWWFARNWALYASPLGLATHDSAAWALGAHARHGVMAHLGARWWEIGRSYWLALGAGNIRATE